MSNCNTQGASLNVQSMQDSRDWLKVGVLAAETGYHPSTLIREIERGALVAVRIGRRGWRISREDWERYLISRRSVPAGGPDAA